ncbi:hypothetical protein [Microvirga thermotolerans]|uniref:Uncharacterized protein n=1 Tax=Microvirga thermotolerans TaxID=2651334 RepID=A0A5P9JY07_9HYPH|nr:hypothetical protein [Microvirga thermotolerans]QFU16115.1 hypothetical protein GDR74_07710 [Microvirga thermotolerans]
MRRPLLAAAFMLAFTAPAAAQSSPPRTDEQAPVTRAEIRELIEAAQATAKASRENVNYSRAVPDLLFQILAKLDKIEDKLDKVETTLKAERASSQKKR